MSVTISIANDPMKSDYETFYEKGFYCNIANVNFASLWRNLGLKMDGPNDMCGSIYPQALRKAIEESWSLTMTRETKEEKLPGGATWIEVGITPERAQRYYDNLLWLCNEAEKREEMIIWA